MSMAALNSLKNQDENTFEHTAAHDLESLFCTLLVICLYTKPGGFISTDLKIPMNDWFGNLRDSALARFKVANFGSIDAEVLRHIPDYWKSFKPYLKQLSLATWSHPPSMAGTTSQANHSAYRTILQDALKDDDIINETPIPYAVVPPLKRSRSSKDNVLSRHNKVKVMDGSVQRIDNYSLGA